MDSNYILKSLERVQLINAIADLYDFTDGGIRYRRILLEMSGLNRFIKGFNLEGSAKMIATDLVNRLEKFGTLPERPTYHALGALLSYLITLPDFTLEEITFFSSLIIKYSLINDPFYISTLREQFKISDIIALTNASPKTFSDSDIKFSISDMSFYELEGIINDETNFLDIFSLIGAIYCSQAVGRVEMPEGTPQGSGFLIGPDIFLTNQHVIKEVDYLKDIVVRFGYMTDFTGVAAPGNIFRLNQKFYFSSPASQLDYVLVRLEERPLRNIMMNGNIEELSMFDFVRKGKHRGYLMMVPRLIKAYDRVNIIQHPGGEPLKVVLTHNYVVSNMTESRVHYVADTKNGSSGAPIFNTKWEVIAMHHSGKPYPSESLDKTIKRIIKGNFRVNEGIPIRAILKDFDEKKVSHYLPQK